MTIEKVKQIAREKYDKELTDEQAEKYAERYGKLSDDELDTVSGGCDTDSTVNCPSCGEKSMCVTDHEASGNWSSRYRIRTCAECGYTERESY